MGILGVVLGVPARSESVALVVLGEAVQFYANIYDVWVAVELPVADP